VKFLRILDKVAAVMAEYFSVVVFAVIIFFGASQVVMRYVFNSSLSWSEEAIRYLFICVFFVAASMGMRTDEHVSIDVLTARLPRGLQRILYLATRGLVAFLLVVLIVVGIQYCRITVDSYSPAMEIPFALVYASIPLGSALMLVALVYRLLRIIRGEVSTDSDAKEVH
jgi:C4-dicarboxylate transporter, DctQ subunit